MTKNCKRCNTLKPFSAFSSSPRTKDGYSHICKPCVVDRNREYWRTPKGRISQIFAVQQVNSRARKHAPPNYSREDLLAWAYQQGLEALIATWAAANYSKDLTPSIDRLDDAFGYSFSNIRLVHWKDNNEKMYRNRKSGIRITRQNKRVEQQTLDGKHVAYFPSIALAARSTGITRANINGMCCGKLHVKSVGGFLRRHV